jgi:nucleotide-binding universal stress UspA family protein
MNRFKHLLVHLDLQGTHDRSAVRYASAVSRLGRSRRVEFIHTVPAQAFFAGFLNDSSARTAAWVRQANADIEGLVRGHFRGPAGCRTHIRVLGGAGFHDLLDRLLHQDTDLVLVGKSETNVAFVEKLTRKAPCSVMVLPPVRSVAYRRMLVTTDFSDDSARAMEVAVAFANARKLKQLHCFHGYQIARGYHKTGLPRERFRQEMEAWAQERYREFSRAIDLGGLKATFTCQESPLVGLGILRQARDQRSDLIVMGARGKDALSAALLGSTTAEVVRETQIPTLVVKAKGAGRSFLELLLGNP